jgi:hypothetical protein
MWPFIIHTPPNNTVVVNIKEDGRGGHVMSMGDIKLM